MKDNKACARKAKINVQNRDTILNFIYRNMKALPKDAYI